MYPRSRHTCSESHNVEKEGSLSRYPDQHVPISGRLRQAVSQLPSLTPNFLGPFTLRLLAANSGLSKPASAASYANRRTAASLPLIVDAARPRFLRKMQKQVTTNLLSESRDSDCMSITAFKLCRPRLLSTGALLRSGGPSFIFGSALTRRVFACFVCSFQPPPMRLVDSLRPLYRSKAGFQAVNGSIRHSRRVSEILRTTSCR